MHERTINTPRAEIIRASLADILRLNLLRVPGELLVSSENIVLTQLSNPRGDSFLVTLNVGNLSKLASEELIPDRQFAIGFSAISGVTENHFLGILLSRGDRIFTKIILPEGKYNMELKKRFEKTSARFVSYNA